MRTLHSPYNQLFKVPSGLNKFEDMTVPASEFVLNIISQRPTEFPSELVNLNIPQKSPKAMSCLGEVEGSEASEVDERDDLEEDYAPEEMGMDRIWEQGNDSASSEHDQEII